MLNTDNFIISDYLGKTFSCRCGKEHFVPIVSIIIEPEALNKLPDMISSIGCKKPFLVYDLTTYSIVGQKLQELIKLIKIPYTSYVIKDAEPIPDEKVLGEVLIHFDPACDFIVAVGSGTINDLCRFLSFKLNLPYMIIATAPSMDGFASNVTPLIVNHMKTTYEAHTPYAILGDTSILKNAPIKMIAAGVGDILGKYTCLTDWEIAHCINNEYRCNELVTIVNRSIQTVIDNIELAKSRDSKAISGIMEGLVLSGIAMSFAGNSRPASGSEHHLSHYWEMMFLFQGKQQILHGTKVGIGTVAVLKAYELLFERKVDFTNAESIALSYSQKDWETQMKLTYFDAADSVIALEKEIGKNNPINVLPRLKQLEKNWDEIKKIAQRLPSADAIRNLLSSLDAPADPMAVGIDKITFINSFLVAKELRNRYGLLQILFDLGLTQEIAEQVWEYFQQ
ncbi:MAG: sn-glycerol-phosphate dehydrogenase [Herbinix sp.]|jgi:glycerol-1-phosphate dehydrogenase [NAD(P)+]|nr:sn-glycerol-phosphate dehydrogenase [Herbinix sp.]